MNQKKALSIEQEDSLTTTFFLNKSDLLPRLIQISSGSSQNQIRYANRKWEL